MKDYFKPLREVLADEKAKVRVFPPGLVEALLAERDVYLETLQEVALNHVPEPTRGTSKRAWCRCGNWAPDNCPAAQAKIALHRGEQKVKDREL